MEHDRISISVVSSVFNESGAIESVIRGWSSFMQGLGESYEIVVCDDGSADGSLDILRRLAPEIPNLRIIEGGVNRGYGYGMLTAALASRGEYIATIDSDGQFDIEDIKGLMPPARSGFAVVTGRRKSKRDSLARVIADRCLNLIVRAMFGTKLRDTNCALKLIDSALMKAMHIDSNGYSFPTEICLKAERMGRRVAEVDIGHNERKAGRSKLRVIRTGINFFLFLISLRIRFFLRERRFIREL